MKNLKIGLRLALGFGLVLLMTTLIAGISITRLSSVAEATRQMMETNVATERLVSEWYRLSFTGVRRTVAIVKSSDPALAKFFAKEAADSTAQIDALKLKIEPLLESQRERALLATLAVKRKKYIDSRAAITKFKVDGELDKAEAMFNSVFLESCLPEIPPATRAPTRSRVLAQLS